MIITVAISKGGVGKSTLVRLLASVAAHLGYRVKLIDADTRANLTRWVNLLEQAGNKPDNLHIETTTDPEQVVALAEKYNDENTLVMIDTEGTVNDLLLSALYCADLVLVPLLYSTDEVTAAIQLVNNFIPQVIPHRDGRPVPVMFVESRRNIIDMRANALKELREIIREQGTPVAEIAPWDRITYRDLQAGTTLYNTGKRDNKAIAESESLFNEILQTVAAQYQEAA